MRCSRNRISASLPVGCTTANAAFWWFFRFVTWAGKKSLPYWLAGVLLAGLLFLPYFVAEISNHWQNTHAIIHYFSQEHALYYERVFPTYLLTFFRDFWPSFLWQRNLPRFFWHHSVCHWRLIYTVTNQRNQSRWVGFSILFYFISVVLMLRVFKGDKLIISRYIIPHAVLLLASVLSMLKQRWLQYGVIACIVFLLGQHVGRWLPYNDFAGLQADNAVRFEKTSRHLNSVTISLMTTMSTQFLWPKTFTNITINDSSPIAVDICNTKDQCSWNGATISILPRTRALQS